MPDSNIPIAAGLVLALVAAVYDVRQRRIPNWLTYAGMAAGLALRFAVLGGKGVLTGVEGGLFVGAIFVCLFLTRSMGGGDVKLMTALGCFVGFQQSVQVLLATAIIGGIMAVFYMVLSRRVVVTLRNVAAIVGHHVTAPLRQHPTMNLDNPTAPRMPYGVAIAGGMLYCFLSVTLWR